MGLISHWTGTLTLPPLPERRLKIGQNYIIQKVFGGANVRARIFQSEFKGYDLIRFDLEAPYHEILLRHHGIRKISTLIPVVTSPDISDPSQFPKEFRLEWDSLGSLEGYADTPEKVLDSWVNKFRFQGEDETRSISGLRPPQIGALHALSAHFAIGSDFDPATVVLPTGTGKTETMLALQVCQRLSRTMVIVPSDALRGQISKKFISLGILPVAGAVPFDIAKPRVAIITKGLSSVEEAKNILENANVIITLPNTLEASNDAAISFLAENCSDLIVDEAHHVTASTWQSVKDRFLQKRIIQFTATPFRRDGKRVDGKIVFNFKLGDAQTAGYYRPINLQTIEEYGGQIQRDRAIATQAIQVLNRDRNELNLDHLMMVRVEDKNRAEEIFKIYMDLAPHYKPVVVYSGSGRTRINREALDALMDRGENGSRIVVCVDMLGEGFDLPNLKVAALHDIHKSLAITLQFIGRFTRKGDSGEIGEATVVANIADQKVENKLSNLYAEGADWDKIIKRLSEERIDKEIRLQDVVFGLRESGDLHNHLSLWNLRPALSAQFFKTKCENWHPLDYKLILPAQAESWYSFNEDDDVLVAVICRSEDVSWGNYQNVLNTIYDLLVMRWDREAGVLCLYASDYNALRSQKLAVKITDESTELVTGNPIFNILNNVELPLVKSLGSSRIGAISFTSYFGPNVTEGLASIEKAESELNNLACVGYENGDRVLWGGTQRRGKIWQQKSGTISEWIEWTSSTWGKVSSETVENSNVIRDFLRPERLARSYHSFPIAVQWGEQAQIRFNDRQFVVYGDDEVPLIAVDLEIGGVNSYGHITIRIVSDAFVSEYLQIIDEKLPGGYRHEYVSGPIVKFRKGSDVAIAFEEYLQKDPLIIRYVDGTYSYNCYHIPTNLKVDLYDKNKLDAWDWTGIPLNKESAGKFLDKNTIQYRTYEYLADDFDVVFNDDGCGEAADLVCLKDIDDSTILLCFVHCKGAVNGHISQDIRNFYVVCGQAQKSIVSKHAGLQVLYNDLKRRQETWFREGASRFLKGDMKLLTYFRDKSRRAELKFETILVQPGASISTVTDDALRLLATTELYLFKTTQANYRVILSE